MPANTPYVVADTPAGFVPLRHGLLAAATVIDSPDAHWQGGVQFQLDACGPANTVVVFCPPGGPATGIGKVPTMSIPGSAAEPFTVYGYTDCAPVGFGDDVGDLVARARRHLDRGENRAVERIVWTGTPTAGLVMRPHLAEDTQEFANPNGAYQIELQSAATIVTGTGELRDMLAILEGELANCYGGEGVIHVPARALPYLGSRALVVKEGGILRTWAGHRVAVYSSNNREGPTGAVPAANAGWFYGTGAVTVRRTAVKERGRNPGEFVGKAKNDTVFVVERTYAIDWDCCHIAVQVTFA